MVGGAPLIPVDALIDWYLGSPARALKPEAPEDKPVKLPGAGRSNKAPLVDAFGQFDVDQMVAKALGEIQGRRDESSQRQPVWQTGRGKGKISR
jgi:hypothetical protein